MPSGQTNFMNFTAMLQGAVDWLGGLEIETSATRYAQYLDQLQVVVANPELEARIDDPQTDRILEAFDSGGDLLVIKRDLSPYDSPELRRRLEAFV